MQSNLSQTAAAPIVLGLECGGTRTVAILAKADGPALRRIESGPANSRLLSPEQLEAHFRALAADLPDPAAVGIGMAGVREESDRRQVRAAAAAVWPAVPCWAGNDLETALAAADDGTSTADVTRVIIISGTGSCCFGRNPHGQTTKVGGWGHLLGDKGSGYDIAIEGLRAMIQQLDVTGRWPEPGARVLRTLPLNAPNDLITWVHQAAKNEIAALAVEVFAAAAHADRLARGVIRAAAVRLAADAIACARRLTAAGSPVEFLYVGGVLHHQTAFARAVGRELSRGWPGSRARPLTREGAWGAVAQARSLLPAQPKLPHEIRRARRAPIVSSAPAWPLPRATGLSPTEQRNPLSIDLDRRSVASALDLMLGEDARIPEAVRAEARPIENSIRLIVRAFRRGGRLFYVGAGTSGRLGVLDASECPPTFSVPPEQVQGIMAGGYSALWTSIEGGEDDAEAGAKAIVFRNVTRRDVVVGIAASGRTPFVWGALHQAHRIGAATVLICFNPRLVFPRGTRPNVVIAPEVGPEVLTGSTRLKAGTATKLVLNLLTTLSMVQLGKVISNLMVDVTPSNVKLRERAVRIVRELTQTDPATAQAALAQAGWRVKEALARVRAEGALGSRAL